MSDASGTHSRGGAGVKLLALVAVVALALVAAIAWNYAPRRGKERAVDPWMRPEPDPRDSKVRPPRRDPAVLLAELRKGKPDERRQAAHELGLLGAKAWRAIPALVRALGGADRELRLEAAGALGVVGPKYTVALAQIGDYLSFEERRARAAPPVLALGADGERVRRSALKLLGSELPLKRRGAAYALWRLRSKRPESVGALRRALGDSDADVRKYAALALAGKGRAARAALPALLKLLADKVGAVRTAAAIALWRAGGEREKALDVLVKEVEHGDWHSVLLAPPAIAAMGGGGKEAVGAMVRRYEGHDRLHCFAITEALASMSGAARKLALPKIKSYATHKCAFFRSDLGHTIWRLSGSGEDAVPVLTNVLENDLRDLPRRAAAAALAEMGPDAAGAIPALEKVFKEDQRTAVRADIDAALKRIRGRGAGSRE